jgi:hypothetical protein
MAWLPAASSTVEPARADIWRWAGGGIIRSSVATRYQLGLLRHAGSLIVPLRASTPHGTCESAMNAACSALRSPANDAWNFSRSRSRNPSCGDEDDRFAMRVDGPLGDGDVVGVRDRRILHDGDAVAVLLQVLVDTLPA